MPRKAKATTTTRRRNWESKTTFPDALKRAYNAGVAGRDVDAWLSLQGLDGRSAQVIARLKAEHARGARARNPRRNPDALEAAAALSESFHGRPAQKVTVVQEEEYEYAAVAELGKLVELHVQSPAGKKRLPFLTSGVKVCATPDGQNIVFLGGDQELNLESLGIESDKDQLSIGECIGIVYTTRKGFHDFEKTDYVHTFGEESGEAPLLGYSPLNKRIYLEGGRYVVRPEGIVD